MRWGLCATLALVSSVCACGDDDERPSPDLRADARALNMAMIEDPATGALEEVDEAMLDDLPARAAELLERGAIPASRQQTERLEALEMSSVEGRRLKRRLLDAYRARTRALERSQRILARGDIEDLALVEALGAQREAHDMVLAVDDELAIILDRPEPQKRPPGEEAR